MPEPGDEHRMTLVEHIEELRACVIRALLGLGIATLVGLYFQEQLFDFVAAPHRKAMEAIKRHDLVPLVAQAYSDSVVAYLQVALVGGFILSGPWIVWQIWSFIRAGLYANERKVVTRFFAGALLLFVAGVAFGYLWLIPYCLLFLAKYADPQRIQPLIRLDDYLSMFFTMTFLIGVAFELPLVMMLLARVGLVSGAGFARHRRWAILGAFVVGAVFTPPDPFSQFALALPLWALYEVGILLARGMGRPPAAAA